MTDENKQKKQALLCPQPTPPKGGWGHRSKGDGLPGVAQPQLHALQGNSLVLLQPTENEGPDAIRGGGQHTGV